jgi:hypothetical protein
MKLKYWIIWIPLLLISCGTKKEGMNNGIAGTDYYNHNFHHPNHRGNGHFPNYPRNPGRPGRGRHLIGPVDESICEAFEGDAYLNCLEGFRNPK